MIRKIAAVCLGLAASYSADAKPARKVVIIAHRSASGYLPEHTLPGVALAHGLGADFIEPDVVLTKDGVPVVLHDIHLDATTDAPSVFPDRKRADGRWYVIDFTLAEIKTLKVHERADPKTGKVVFPKRFPIETAVFSVPTLEEEIQVVQGLNKSRGKNVGIYPEIKSPAFHHKEGQDIAKITLALLAKYGYDSADAKVFFQCFDAKELKRVRTELKPKIKLVQLIGENAWQESDTDYDAMRTEAGIKEVATYADGIGPSLSHILAADPKAKTVVATPLVGWAHKYKMVVHPYTLRADDLPPGVPTVDAFLKLIFDLAKADGLFTDFTDKAVEFLKRS